MRYYAATAGLFDTINNLAKSVSAGITTYKGPGTPPVVPVASGGTGIPTWMILAGVGGLAYLIFKRK